MESTEALADLRVKVKTIDAGLLGRRIRHARQRAGMTQGDAAGTDMSTAYISRIEAGQRRPGADLLIALSERLRCAPEELLAPDDSVVMYDAAVVARLTVELDYAEIEFRTGSADVSLGRVEAVLAEAARTSAVPASLRDRASLARANAFEALGRTFEAIDAFEAVAANDADPMRLIEALTALSRCYLQSGDYARAADIGERAAALVDEREPVGSTEGLKLAVTVAAAHYERGDVNYARRICERALSAADRLDSPDAQAAAYWNTSLMESRQGNHDAALSLAGKALSLLEAADDSRSLTRLQIAFGVLHLASEPSLPAEALTILERAEIDGRTSAISAADRARIKVGTARANLMLGNFAEAREAARAAQDESAGISPIFVAEAGLILGQALSAEGEVSSAIENFRAVAQLLHDLTDDEPEAGQLWFELGTLLDQHDLIREAAHAYRSAGSTAGLRRPQAGVPAG